METNIVNSLNDVEKALAFCYEKIKEIKNESSQLKMTFNENSEKKQKKVNRNRQFKNSSTGVSLICHEGVKQLGFGSKFCTDNEISKYEGVRLIEDEFGGLYFEFGSGNGFAIISHKSKGREYRSTGNEVLISRIMEHFSMKDWKYDLIVSNTKRENVLRIDSYNELKTLE